VEITFYSHVNVLKAIFCVLGKLGESGRVVPRLLLVHDLHLESSHFKVTMTHNFKVILWEENSLNLVTKLWHKINKNPILNHKLSEFMKLTKIVVVLVVFGLVENEHTFDIINFMKSRLQNQLNTRLDLYTHVFNQRFFILQSFHYDQTITKWQNKIHYCVNV
jgi:hypothetical protein